MKSTIIEIVEEEGKFTIMPKNQFDPNESLNIDENIFFEFEMTKVKQPPNILHENCSD